MHGSPPLSFATLLRRYRRAAGLTQEELAERASLSKRGISDLERGVRLAPRQDTVDLLAVALGLNDGQRREFVKAVQRTRGRVAVDDHQPQDACAPTRAAELYPLHLLPVPPTPLIGRLEEVQLATGFLVDGGVRLLTFTGPGGVGKTRMAIATAAAVEGRIADTTIFLSLSPVTAADLVLEALAAALRVREGRGSPLLDTLIQHLYDRRMLLVLDNFEHLLLAAPQIAALLAGCPGLRILVSSRAALRVRGEQELAIRPLAVPGSGAETLASLAQNPAVQLFVGCTRSLLPQFRLTDLNGQAVSAICRRLDGLPLALELAAARSKLLAPAELLQRLERNLTVIGAGMRDLPERQQTLQSTINWSYGLLHPAAQALFRRVAVFSGECSIDAIEAVCSVDTSLEGDLLDWLSTLLDQSLLARNTLPDGSTRISILETVRAFGLARCREQGEEAATRLQHAQYFLSLAEPGMQALAGQHLSTWLDQIEREYDNVRAALLWALHAPNIPIGVQLATALRSFWTLRGHFSEGQRWYNALLGVLGENVPAERAALLRGAGAMAYNQGRYAEAAALFEQSLELLRAQANLPETARVLNDLAHVIYDQGDYRYAASLYEQSLKVQEELGNRRGMATSLNSLGNIAYTLGDFARASALLEQSLALNRELDDRRAISVLLMNLGVLAAERGNEAQAQLLLEESLGLRLALGDRKGYALTLGNLGELRMRLGAYQVAFANFAEALALFRELGDQHGIGSALNFLGKASGALGDLAQAQALCRESLALCTQIAEPAGRAAALLSLGELARRGDDLTGARLLLEEALTLFEEIGERANGLSTVEEIAATLSAMEDTRVAVRLYAAVAAARVRFAIPPLPEVLLTQTAALNELRAELGDEQFAVNWEAGFAVSWDVCVAAFAHR